MGNLMPFDEEAALSDLPETPEKIKAVILDYEKKIYKLKELVKISCSLCSTTDLPVLMESILYIFMCHMHVLGAGLFMLDALDADMFNLDSNYTGLEPDRDILYTIPVDSPVIHVLTKEDTVFTLEELRRLLPSGFDICIFESLHPTMIVPMILKNHLNGILLLGERIDVGDGSGKAYTEDEKNEILKIALFCSVAINNAALVERSSTDMMTHLKNKYFFFNRLTDEIDLAVSQNMLLSVIMYDVDFFKSVNDTYGHACGDYVLTTIAQILMDNIRSKDLACRYGGEELTVMLYNTAKDDALQVAERIREKIAAYDFQFENRHLHVTISGGVAVFSSNENPVGSAKELVDQADQGLYMAKHNGRNRIEYAHPKLVSKFKEK